MRRRRPPTHVLASTATLVIASLALVAALWSVLRPSSGIPPSSPPPPMARGIPGIPPGDAEDGAPAALVLAHDPFDPDRGPGDVADAAPTGGGDVRPPAPAVTIRLLGTIVRSQGSIAFCQLQAETPRVVRVGERCGDFLVLSIDQGRAAFRARDGARLELSLTPAGS